MIKPKFPSLRSRSSNGLSLIEVCLAIAILAIIFTNLSFIFDQGYLFLRKTRLSRQAFFLAEEKIEELLSADVVNDPDGYNETKYWLDPPFEAFQRLRKRNGRKTKAKKEEKDVEKDGRDLHGSFLGRDGVLRAFRRHTEGAGDGGRRGG